MKKEDRVNHSSVCPNEMSPCVLHAKFSTKTLNLLKLPRVEKVTCFRCFHLYLINTFPWILHRKRLFWNQSKTRSHRRFVGQVGFPSFSLDICYQKLSNEILSDFKSQCTCISNSGSHSSQYELKSQPPVRYLETQPYQSKGPGSERYFKNTISFWYFASCIGNNKICYSAASSNFRPIKSCHTGVRLYTTATGSEKWRQGTQPEM